MVHHCCSKQKVKRGLWSPEEDEKLFNYITSHGHGSWSSVPKLAGLQRCGKSCRLRWINYLRPDLKKGSFTQEEERTIIEVHRIIGNRWAQIAKHLPGRTDNEVKNFWNSCIKKKLLAQGLDPNTHNLLPSNQKHPKRTNNNNASKITKNTTLHITKSNSTSLVFSIDHISNDQDITMIDIETCFASPPPPPPSIVDLEHSNNFGLNEAKDQNTQNPNFNTQPCMVDEGSMWSTSAQMPEVMSSTCEEKAPYGLKNLQNLDAYSFNGQDFDLGFGDYYSPAIMPDYYKLYGDMSSAMDHAAWDNC